jgi:hypothetical protein
VWYARDQQILWLILSSAGKEVQLQIIATEMAEQAWSTVEKMFSAQTRATTMNVRLALTTTKKGNMSNTHSPKVLDDKGNMSNTHMPR